MTDPIFIIEMDFGKLGREFSGDRNMTRSAVIETIVSGCHKVVKVLEIHEDEHRCSDVTEDIAREIADRFHSDREPVPHDIQNFIQAQLGVTATRGLNLSEAA